MKQPIEWDDVHGLMGRARALARRLLRFEAHGRSLQTTGLVLTGLRRQKLSDQDWSEVAWADAERFLAAMYRAMERALKDHGRRRSAHRRRAGQQVALEDLAPAELLRLADFQPHELEPALHQRPEAVEALAGALAMLECRHPELACVARHRHYGGLTVDQTARMTGVAERTVRRRWEKARMLLHREILRRLNSSGHDLDPDEISDQ